MVVGVAMLVFGPKRIPEIGASLGKGIKEFRKSVTTTKSEIFSEDTDAPPPQRDPSREVPTVHAEGSEPKRLMD